MHTNFLTVYDNVVLCLYFRPQLLVLCKLNDDLKPKTDNLFAFVGQLKAGNAFQFLMSVAN
jgi:hypothetical protein